MQFFGSLICIKATRVFSAAMGFGSRFRMIVFMLLAHVSLSIHGALVHFPNVDEVAYLPAGVSHLIFGEFDLYKVNPPLVRVAAALPAVIRHHNYDWSYYSERPGERPEFAIGRQQLKSKGLRLIDEFVLPRMVCITFSVLGCLLLASCCYNSFGARSANIACGFWCFCPNMLAHGQTIVPDVGSVAFGLAAAVGCFRYLVSPSLQTAVGAGLVFGIALLTKLTWISGFVSFPIAIALSLFLYRSFPHLKILDRLIHLAFFCSVALFVLNAGYLFEGSFTRLGDYRFCSESLGGSGASRANPSNRFEQSRLTRIPVPLPINYVSGIDFLKSEVEGRYHSFLLGEWKHGSWWYYYIVTTAVKTPLATLFASFIGLAVFYRRWNHRSKAFFLILAVPAAIGFFSVSFAGGFNHHHRYVLFIYPPMYFLASGISSDSSFGLVASRLVTVLCVSASIASFSVWPHFLGFFNSTVGGPTCGWKILGFSNVDWGQDLLLVNTWIGENINGEYCAVQAEFYDVDETFFGLPKAFIPRFRLQSNKEMGPTQPPGLVAESRLPRDGLYIINVRSLFDHSSSPGFGYFRFLKPFDRIGYSFMVYRVGEDERKLIRSLVLQ